MTLSLLVPINPFQRCAMASLASVENHKSWDGKQESWPTSKPFLKSLQVNLKLPRMT